ncbi:hypothetical protein [Moritella sp.]|uniref:hypothetical protein n=1 Tax=Moritella sp. TaxID=78556 RepID=UPI003439FE83
MSTNVLLSIAAVLNAIVALLHIGCIYYGIDLWVQVRKWQLLQKEVAFSPL